MQFCFPFRTLPLFAALLAGPALLSASVPTSSLPALPAPPVLLPQAEPQPAEQPWLDLRSLMNVPTLLFEAFQGPLPLGYLPLLSVTTPVEPPCLVTPLHTLQDEEALAFESGDPSVRQISLRRMQPATRTALHRFTRVVAAVGGSVAVTSAYRPPAYQDHLRGVWEKWMYELRDNGQAECQELRAQMQEEFVRHELLESQRPVPFSDHTRGLAFDARVSVPVHAHLRRVRVDVDDLAQLSRLYRPAPVADWVHFRLLAR